MFLQSSKTTTDSKAAASVSDYVSMPAKKKSKKADA